MKSHQKGFTLLELLVVLAIIGIISTIVIASLSKARMKARDAQRMSDIKQINNAIQLYILANGHAPYIDGALPGYFAISDRSTNYNPSVRDWDDLALKLRPYISRLPVDPCPSCDNDAGGVYFRYDYSSPGIDTPNRYEIWATNLEVTMQPFGISNNVNGTFDSS